MRPSLGIVDYGHRCGARRLPELGAQDQRHLELVAVLSPEFEQPSREFQQAVGVDAQKAACTKIETILNEDEPVGMPYTYDYLAGNLKKFTGVYSSALGQIFLEQGVQG